MLCINITEYVLQKIDTVVRDILNTLTCSDSKSDEMNIKLTIYNFWAKPLEMVFHSCLSTCP